MNAGTTLWSQKQKKNDSYSSVYNVYTWRNYIGELRRTENGHLGLLNLIYQKARVALLQYFHLRRKKNEMHMPFMFRRRLLYLPRFGGRRMISFWCYTCQSRKCSCWWKWPTMQNKSANHVKDWSHYLEQMNLQFHGVVLAMPRTILIIRWGTYSISYP